MKKKIRYHQREIVLKCIEMSHSSVGGEYEIGFSEKLVFNLDKIWNSIKHSGYLLDESHNDSISLTYNNAVITVLKKGRILIQNLLPDTFDEAIKIGEDLLNAEEANEK